MADPTKKSMQPIKKVVANNTKKRNSNNALELNFEPGENNRFLAHAIEIYNLPSIDLNNAEQVKERIMDYFKICLKNDMKPNIAGVANALSISRQYLWEIANGKTPKNKDVVDTIKKVQYLICQQMEDFMQNGKINPVAGIFLMKNNLNYKDEQEIVLTPGMDEKTSSDLINEAKLLDT